MTEVKLKGHAECLGLDFPLKEGRYLVGRTDEADLRLDKPQVSRRHAEITVEEGKVQVCDLGSHNGTSVNGAKVTGTITLNPGDKVEFANLGFRVDDGTATAEFSRPVTMLGRPFEPSVEISWDEVSNRRERDRDLQSLLFRVLAEAGNLLTIPRAPREMYGPILDMVETALLKPERIFVLQWEHEGDEPVETASRVLGRGADALVLSSTMVDQVLREKKSFLTSDPLNHPDLGGMRSMVSQGIRSAIAVPMFDNEDVIGILYADDSRPGRVFTRDQLAAFTLLANIIAVALTHARYHELEQEKHRQDAELATAVDILEHMLPAELPEVAGYEVLARLESCYEVGGDLYEATTLEDGRYAFLVGDVTGKGVGAALLVSRVLSLTHFMLREGWEPSALVARLNDEIFRCTDHVRFTTLFLGFLVPESGHIVYVNAGHNPPMVVRSDGATEECAPTGLPVGMLEGMEYGTGETTLGPGDMIAMFSDGITETQNEADEDFGEDRLAGFLARERTADLALLFDDLRGELGAFRGNAPIGDDITLVAIRRCKGDGA
ncbi:hypothetical protein CO151_02215 [bacterium CG_4_9_14_3_um_filter_65_15]|nr:MAG: hypothetical protein CO151_02215 [bacterium CG_4_9_14_3_um_filter_65_15]